MTFTVERKLHRGSKPADTIRQGRVDGASSIVPDQVALAYVEREDGCIYVLRCKAEVGVICRQDAARGQRPGFNWLCFLPEQKRMPQFAADLPKAKDAIRVVVESWFEAAGMIAKPPRRKDVVAWRAGEGA